MDFLLDFIYWNPDIEIFRIGGFALRWYATCWVLGLLLGYCIVRKLYIYYKIDEKLFSPLFFYCFFGVLIGARLGHCLFYEPDYFLASGKNFVEMILPIRFLRDGSWRFIGYEGLSSHGGVFGMLIGYWMYCKKTKLTYLFVLDNVAVAAPFTGMFIRTGNLMNSEILGKVTDVPWAFVFERVDMMPRHPGQLYEALFYLLVGIIGLIIFFTTRMKKSLGTGFYFGYCVGMCFTFRFFIEFLKEVQEEFENSMVLDMGQILSIPLAIAGFYCMIRGIQKFNKQTSK